MLTIRYRGREYRVVRFLESRVVIERRGPRKCRPATPAIATAVMALWLGGTTLKAVS